MSRMPASLETQTSACRLTRVVGLFLARLYAHLVRLHRSGETTVPPDIAYMVASAEIMVHDVMCVLAERKLRAAGYHREADVLRGTGISRPVHTPSGDVSPFELITRLETTLIQFEQAEAQSERLARFVVCFFAFLYTDAPKPACYVIIKIEHARVTPPKSGPAPAPWPPPTRRTKRIPLAA